MSRRYMVTGSQGFLGRYVTAAILADDPDAVVLGLGRSARTDVSFTHLLRWPDAEIAAPLPAHLKPYARHARYDYRRVDIGDAEDVAAKARQFKPDIVLHLAASLRGASWPRLFESNIAPALALVEGLTAANVQPRILLGSSGSVYGAPEAAVVPFHETAACRPIDPYAASKRAAEDIVRIAGRQHGLSVVSARIFNLTGPGLQEQHLCAALARQVVLIERERSPPIVRVGPLAATRDFVDVRDAAAALLLLAKAQAPDETYNIGSGVERASEAVLTGLLERARLGEELLLDRQLGREADAPRLAGDIGRLRTLGFAPAIAFEQSLQDMLDYYRGLQL